MVRSRYVGLATRDPALYAELAAALRERRLPTVSLLPQDRVPERVAVVLTSPAEADAVHFSRVLPVAPGGTHAGLWAAVQETLLSGERLQELTVGVDPGPRPGYAVLGGGRCLEEGTLGAPEDVALLGRSLKRRFPSTRLHFRVGSGDHIPRDRILNALRALHVTVEVVDERNTTPPGKRRGRDPVSARLIARTLGRLVEGEFAVRATPGEIADLQRRSREESGGRFTIPRSLASRVLEGKISFPEAIREAAAGSSRPRGAPGAARGKRTQELS